MVLQAPMFRIAVGSVAFFLGAAVTIVAARGLERLYEGLQSGGSAAQVITWELLRLATPLVGGAVGSALALSWCGRSREKAAPGARRRRVIAWSAVLLLACYGVTWAFGAPAVITHLTREDVKAYKSALAQGRTEVAQPFPHSSTSMAVPVVPGLVLVYHEMQVAGLWGWGGWVLCAWYPGHVRVLTTRVVWLS